MHVLHVLQNFIPFRLHRLPHRRPNRMRCKTAKDFYLLPFIFCHSYDEVEASAPVNTFAFRIYSSLSTIYEQQLSSTFVAIDYSNCANNQQPRVMAVKVGGIRLAGGVFCSRQYATKVRKLQTCCCYCPAFYLFLNNRS